jgi:tRNA/rRNA methyltransferase
MTPRDFGPPTGRRARTSATLARRRHRVAFVFGPERTGMSNDDVYRCHACLSIPAPAGLRVAEPGAGGAAHGLRLAPGAGRLRRAAAHRRPEPGRRAAVQGMLAHWQQVLVEIGFLDPAAPKKLMPRLQQLLNRAQLTQEEVHILRGIARGTRCGAPQAPAAERTPLGTLART